MFKKLFAPRWQNIDTLSYSRACEVARVPHGSEVLVQLSTGGREGEKLYTVGLSPFMVGARGMVAMAWGDQAAKTLVRWRLAPTPRR